MTENKRFIQKDEAIINTMTDELVTASSEDSAEIIVDWLNRIFEKNGELSKENYGLQDGLDFYREQNAYLSEQLTECLDAREAYKDDWKACVSYCDTYKDEIHTYKDNIEGLKEENEQLKKEYYQMRNLYFENAEDICDNCKHRYLVEVKDMQGYYHQKCKKGYGECPKGTVTYCGDFELKGDVDD